MTTSGATPEPGERGFTLLELLLIIAVICLLAAFIIPTLQHGDHSFTAGCFSRLRQIDLGFAMYASDNTNLFPMQASVTNGGTMERAVAGQLAPNFEKIHPYYPPPQGNQLYRLLVCPADKYRQTAAGPHAFGDTNISYFLNIDAQCTNQPSHVILAGDRDLKLNKSTASQGLLTLTTNSDVDWAGQLHAESGNVAFADGHVERFSVRRLSEAFRDQPLETNRLAMP